MKNCLICQTGQDQVALNRIPVSMEGRPWGDVLVCASCFEALGAEEVKNLIGIAIREKSFEPSNVFLAGEAMDAEYEGTVAGALASGTRAAEQIVARAIRSAG